MRVNNELGSIWKEAVVVQFKVLFRHSRAVVFNLGYEYPRGYAKTS
jgi:hypothetical protein